MGNVTRLAEVEIVKSFPCTLDKRHYNSLYLTRVINGKARLLDEVTPIMGGFFRQVTLDGMTLFQSKDTEVMHTAPFGFGRIAPGIGLENIGCFEMQEVHKSFLRMKRFEGMSQSFDMIKPLLSLMPSGYYFLADVFMCPTNGGSKFFWNIDSEPALCPAYSKDIDCIDVTSPSPHPRYLYPSKHPSHFSEKMPDYRGDDTLKLEESPRCIAYALSNSLALLLDGHHKATLRAEYGESVPCLLIIPHLYNDANGNYRFADISISPQYIDSKPVFVQGQRTDFNRFDMGKSWFPNPTLNSWRFYPSADMIGPESIAYLIENAGRLLNYQSDLLSRIQSWDES